MNERNVSEGAEELLDRRPLCQPRHLLHARDGYSLYAYGDVFEPGGAYLGHIDELDDHEDLPFELEAIWGGFVKYWHGGGHLDRWDDDISFVVRLDHPSGQYLIEHESMSGHERKLLPDRFASVGGAIARVDLGIRGLMAS